MKNRLDHLRNEKAACLDEMEAILRAADSGEPTDQQNEDYNALEKRLEKLNIGIEREEKFQAEELSMRSVPDNNQAAANQGQMAEPELPPQQFESLGEQLVAVMNASRPGGFVDPKLAQIGAATGLSEGVASAGGFLVQTDFSNQLIAPIFDGGQIGSRVTRIGISSNSNGLKMNAVNQTSRADGSRWGGVQSYWLNEAGSKTASKPEWRQMELDLKKLIGLCYATDELLQDAVALESIIRQAFADEFTFKVEDAVINGTGAGQPLGILNAACLVSVAKETGQAATTIVAENIEKMYSRLHARSMANAVWLINQDCWPQLFQLSHAVGTGGVPMFVPAGGINQAPNGTLLGRPIIPVEYCQTLGTKGDIYLGDFSQYLLIDKGGTQSASSIHVNFTYDETVFRFVYRVDGQPAWNSALTPYKGTDTQSPFVTLAVRS